MHELSEFAKRILDVCALVFAAVAAITLHQIADTVTIVAGLISATCGLIRIAEWLQRRSTARSASKDSTWTR